MKDFAKCCLGLLACLGSAFAQETVQTLRVMPVGDSITYGVGGTSSGYRAFLERALLADGFTVDYVGTSTANASAGLLDPDHCGYSGWYLTGNGSSNIRDAIGGWLDRVDAPHVVLLHIGTNDAKDGLPLTDRPQALSDVLDTIAAKAPQAHVIVTTVLKRTDDAEKDANIEANFNAHIEAIAAAHGEKVHFLDMRARLEYPADLADRLHPNDSGYRKMAEAWHGEITKLFAPANPPPTPGGRAYATNVPESEWHPYVVVYDFTPVTLLDGTHPEQVYAVNRAAQFAGTPFDRVAYYMELQRTADDPVEYVWTSFEPFASDLSKLGIPTAFTYQGDVRSMNVFSNVRGVPTGTGIGTGCVEFWPTLFAEGPDGKFDCDDAPNSGRYGSMQIHDRASNTTLFSYSAWWWASWAAGLGIGNCPPDRDGNKGIAPDWTFAKNIDSFVHKRIQVLVRFTAKPPAEPVRTTGADFDAVKEVVTVSFGEPVRSGDLADAAFTVPGFEISKVVVAKDGRSVELRGRVTHAGATTLSVSGVHAASGAAVAPASFPLELVANPAHAEAAAIAAELEPYVGTGALDGYELLFAADIPVTCSLNTRNGANVGWLRDNFYRKDRRAELAAEAAGVDRIAYCLVLQKEGQPAQYVWTAMDAFTQDFARMGAPELGYYFQTCVTNLDVLSNVDGVVNVTGSPSGIIEFTAGQYTMEPNNDLTPTIGSAGGQLFDWNDSGFSTEPGNLWGCMQVHNWGERQCLWAFNHFNGGTPGLGIGNESAGGHRDWTLAQNAGTFTVRRLYGLVRRSRPDVLPVERRAYSFDAPATLAQVDEAPDYDLLYDWDIPVKGVGAYAVDNSATAPSAFDRVAYYLELATAAGVRTWTWVSMDAFTDEPAKLGVPSTQNGAIFQQKVTDMNVYASANVAEKSVDQGGVVTGKHIDTGNIEIWPSMFERGPGPAEFGGDPAHYDWNDEIGKAQNTFGQISVNNYGAEHTIFAVNGFYYNLNIGLGIGNCLSNADSRDWTLAWNAGNYATRRLLVLVRRAPHGLGSWGEATQWLAEPKDMRMMEGATATLSVEAIGAVRWQWFHDGAPVDGATEPVLTLADAPLSASGAYRCLVETADGASFTRTATVRVLPSGTTLFFR